MESVRDLLRKVNQDRSKESISNSSKNKDSTSKPDKILANASKEKSPSSEKRDKIKQAQVSSRANTKEMVDFTNQKISTMLWRLHEYTQRSLKYSHLQIVFKLVTDPHVKALLKFFEEDKTKSSLVCKVRLKSAAVAVKRLLVTSGGGSSSSKLVESVSVCEEIASKHESINDGTFEEVSTWMDKVATLHGKVEKSYAKFVKQLNHLREEFRSVHRRKEVGGVPDMDGPMEDLTRTLSKANEEDLGKMVAMSSKWLVGEVNMLFKVLDECSSKLVDFSSSLYNNGTKETRDCSRDKNKVKKIETEVTKVDAEVQTEFVSDNLASSLASVTKGSVSPSSPPIAHSTPRSSFSEGSNPLGKLEDISDNPSSGGEEFRYEISSVLEMIAETYDKDVGVEKIRKLLDLFDDGTKTVKSSIVDLIVDKCPHLFN